MNTTNDYRLYKDETVGTAPVSEKGGAWRSAREFFVYIKGDGWNLFWAFVLVIGNSVAGVITPFLVAQALDTYIVKGDIAGLTTLLMQLGALFGATVVIGYIQGRLTGGVAQRTLYRLRAALFVKLQELPIAFFNQNKAGDLTSRLNNDTDKLNQFLSESITRFVGNFFALVGIAIFVLYINWRLGLVMLSAVGVLIIITKLVAPLVEWQNKKNLDAVGGLSASVQENLTNFRVIAAYGKREYFKSHLDKVSQSTFVSALRSGTANRVFEPIYDFAGAGALIAVLAYGMHLLSVGQLTIGLLVAFVSYTQKFYDPLRILATIFGSIQLSLAAWSRIRAVFTMESRLTVLSASTANTTSTSAASTNSALRMQLTDVSFGYVDTTMVVENVNLAFEKGKTYALVGPTGGGKSTLVNLMARLYDPLTGEVFLNGRDIRSFEPHERTEQVSVILQDPLLFSGTVGENIRYGNEKFQIMSALELEKTLRARGLGEVIGRFDQGLATQVTQGTGAGLSIGQKQLISFMRAILREPKLLILDEATANIDTITEAVLTKALETLPADTTKVIIAHRLNTIEKADEIMFVNGHHVTRAGNFDEAVKLIEHAKRTS